MDTQRLILFVVFSFSLLLLWEAWQNKDQVPQATAPTEQVESQKTSGVPAATPTAQVQQTQQAPQGKGLVSGARAIIETEVFRAEIDANGGDLRKLELLAYHPIDKSRPTFLLLEDDPARPYVAQSGLLWGLPTHKDVFQLSPGVYKMSGETLSVPMTWSNPVTGLAVEKTYVFHRNSYEVEVVQKITNGGSAAVQVESYAQLMRNGKPPQSETRFMNAFTGPVVYTDEAKFQKIKFADIDKGDAEYQKSAKDGWVGMLQHHFVAAWLPKAGEARSYYVDKLGDDLYTAGYKQQHGSLAPGQTISLTSRIYLGPQLQKNLEAAAPGLELSRDYGWLTPLSAPMFWVLSKIHAMVGNWGWAIVIFTILLKLVLWPLSATGYKGMAQMRKMAPRLQKMKEMYGDDRQKLHQAMADLYKKEKINPLNGCMPILLQIPVFIALYYVLIAAVEMRGAPWLGWITDLSAPDPFYVLPVLMGLSSIIQVKLNPTPPDPMQAKIMMAMPIVFSVMFVFFASGLVLYWLVNNILSIAQQWAMNKKYGEGSGGKTAHAKK